MPHATSRTVSSNAALDCLDRERQLLERRMENADEMLSLFEQRLEQGDATALEVNKIRMERMNAAAELSRNATARTTVAESLRAMNGDKSVSLEGARYPVMPSIGSFDEFREKMMPMSWSCRYRFRTSVRPRSR